MQTQNFKEQTNEQLVIEFQQTKNNQVFGEIYSRFYDNVFHICLGKAKDKNVAYDLAQDIMIKVMDKLEMLEHANLLGVWIHRIACNCCMDYFNTQRRQKMVAIDDSYNLEVEETDMDAINAKELQLDRVEGLMHEIGEKTCTILRLKYQEGYSIKQIQEMLQLSESAVKMRLKRGKAQVFNLYNSPSKRTM